MKTRRFLSAVLSVLMVLSLFVPASAAPAMLDGEDLPVVLENQEEMIPEGEIIEEADAPAELPAEDAGDITESEEEPAALLAAGEIYKEGGWLESAFIEWTIADGVKSYKAYVKEASASTWTELDPELVREYPGYMRADALGLKAGTYQMKAVADTGAELVSGNLTVVAHDRSGWAFESGKAPGAYNMDGTLMENAKVIYITNDNKDTITVNLNIEGKGEVAVKGLQNIVLAYKKSNSKVPPMAVRLIGKIDVPSGNLKGDIQPDTGEKACHMTVEGVGNDAVANGWGFVMKNCSYLELRNLAFMNCHSDEGDNIGLQQTNDHIWVHNCDSFYGDAGGDADQAKGDGALDTKKSHYVTHSYNHFWDNGKCNLQGASSSDTSNYITYHHNWYDHCDSRCPRVRVATVHVYNNYYDGVSKYGVGSTTDSDVFVENNYFRGTVRPMMISKQGTDAKGDGTFSGEAGGVIKAFGNTMEGATYFIPYTSGTDFDAYVAKTRDEKVPSTVKASTGAGYNNFDTDTSNYVGKKDYLLDTPAAAREKIMKYAGRVEGGDFDWKFNNAVDDSDYGVVSALKSAVHNYESSMLSWGGGVTKGSSAEHTEHTWGSPEVTTKPTCTTNGVGTITCLFPGCGATDTVAIPGGHDYVNGECTVCHEKEPEGGGSGPAGGDTPGGGTGTGGSPSATTTDRKLNASEFKMTAPLDTENKRSALAADELAEKTTYFTMDGTVNKRIPKGGKVGDAVQFFDLIMDGSNGFKFTVADSAAPASLTASFSSAGDSKSSTLILEKADGNRVNNSAGANYATQKTTKATTVTFNDLAAGTYIIRGATDGNATNDVRLYSATVTETVSAHQHQFGEWTIVRAANCGVDGWREHICSECKTKVGETIEATGNHTWGDWSAPDADGEKTRECSVCHQVEHESAGTVTPTPTPTVSKDALNAAIAAANEAKAGVVTSTDGKDVPSTIYWVTAAQLKTLKDALTAAENTAADADATADAVKKATDDLNAAVNTFKTQKAKGTQSSGGTGTGESTAYTLVIGDVINGLKTTPATGWDPAGTIQYTAAPLTGQGTNGFFTIYPKAKGSAGKESKFEPTKEGKFGSDTLTGRINFGGAAALGEGEGAAAAVNSIGFTTNGPATVKVWWVGGNSDEQRHMTILKSDGNTAADSPEAANNKAMTVSEMKLTDKDTYYLGGKENNNNVYKVEVTVDASSSGGGGTTVTPVDKTALDKALSDAAAAKVGVVTSADGKDIAKDTYWVTEAQLKALNDAINAADAVATKAAATADEVKKAADDLNKAVNTFKGQKALGTKTEGGTVTPPTPSTVKVTKITISGSKSVAEGKTITLTAAVSPDNATNKAVTWSSDKQGVATVSATGVVTGVAAGKATITATAKDGSGVKGTWEVEVIHPSSVVPVTRITITGSKTGKVNATLSLRATVYPDTATDKGIYWTSSDTHVLSIVGNNNTTQSGASLTFKGISIGKATVTATATDGSGVKATWLVEITSVGGGGSSGGGGGGGSSSGGGGGGGSSSGGGGSSGGSSGGGASGGSTGTGTGTPSATTHFVDVKSDDWFCDAVTKAFDQGLMKGTDDTHFAPNDTTTRAMVATVLYRLDGEPTTDVHSAFNDVESGLWYSDAIDWAAQKGVVTGYGDGNFAPNDNVTREQLALMLFRYANPSTEGQSEVLSQFVDASSVSGWATEAMQWAVNVGIITGKGGGVLDPQGQATRAEICTMLIRFTELKK